MLADGSLPGMTGFVNRLLGEYPVNLKTLYTPTIRMIQASPVA